MLGEVAFEAAFDSGEGGAVGEIFEDRGIEKAVGARRVHGETEDVAAVEITGAEISVLGVEASSPEDGGAMYATRGIAIGRGFDHASELAAEFGRNSGSVCLQRLHIIEIIGGSEGRRAVVEYGQSIHNVLRIVFGGAGMEDSVGLQNPAGL